LIFLLDVAHQYVWKLSLQYLDFPNAVPRHLRPRSSELGEFWFGSIEDFVAARLNKPDPNLYARSTAGKYLGPEYPIAATCWTSMFPPSFWGLKSFSRIYRPDLK
jgi:hypothetical protein